MFCCWLQHATVLAECRMTRAVVSVCLSVPSSFVMMSFLPGSSLVQLCLLVRVEGVASVHRHKHGG